MIGIDWRTELATAKSIVEAKSIQGNLDPLLLLSGDWKLIQQEVDRMLRSIDSKQGYIFNLGHGILPGTDEVVVRKLVDYIHEQ